jgi:Family of unknown function (DUF5946)
MSGSTTCPGCGLQLPASGVPWDRRRNASPECWQLYGEVQGFALRHLELVRDFQQLTVDAYAAQHGPRDGGGDVPPISVAYALVGLHLALDRGASGIEVRTAHQRMVTGYVDHAHGTMTQTGQGGHFTEVVLRPQVSVASPAMVDAAMALHAAAHRACFIASSVNFPVRHEPHVQAVAA